MVKLYLVGELQHTVRSCGKGKVSPKVIFNFYFFILCIVGTLFCKNTQKVGCAVIISQWLHDALSQTAPTSV